MQTLIQAKVVAEKLSYALHETNVDMPKIKFMTCSLHLFATVPLDIDDLYSCLFHEGVAVDIDKQTDKHIFCKGFTLKDAGRNVTWILIPYKEAVDPFKQAG